MNQTVNEKTLGAAAPLKHHEFRPDINGLRAIAVLSVLAFHAGLPAPGGFAGVDIFFVISGFLISRIILSERAAANFSLLDFYGKRVKRILPALLLILFTSWIVGWFLLNPPQYRLLGGHMEGSSYFSVNLWLLRQASGPAAYFDTKSRLLPMLHLWSLSIEEQFYLVWPALMLILFRFKRLLAPAIGLIFLLSLAWGIYMTPVSSTAAFYMLSTRAWELALGALLAWREVFRNPAPPGAALANLGAGAGVALMIASIFWLIDENSSWPGYLALAPTLGCALVIASPGAWISQILLGNRVAQFFGGISYPLYLWHWPLLAFAHHQLGETLAPGAVAALLVASVVLAWLTWRFIERPVARAYLKRPVAVAAPLLAGLALAGTVGSVTRQTDGVMQRFPAYIQKVYAFQVQDGKHMLDQIACTEAETWAKTPIDKARARVHAFFTEHKCGIPPRPDLPTIFVVGDSHGLHLVSGLKTVFRDRANILHFSVIGCRPLLTKVEEGLFETQSNRCRAVNEELVRVLAELKPAAVVVGAYFANYYPEPSQLASFLHDFDINIAEARQAGVTSPIFVMGQVPTWSPDVADIVIGELYGGRKPVAVTRDHLQAKSLETERLLAAHQWGENVHYLSQVAKLCGAEGCKRFVGPRVPDDMVAVDYGHYSRAGSLDAAQNILGPVLTPIIEAGLEQKAK